MRPVALGVGLLALGTVPCAAVAAAAARAEVRVGFSAVPTVLGAVLLAPPLLRLVGRVAGRLPLPLRFAVRDADRQRGRTAPAVAAVAATVAGAVALGTAAGSDAADPRDLRPRPARSAPPSSPVWPATPTSTAAPRRPGRRCPASRSPCCAAWSPSTAPTRTSASLLPAAPGAPAAVSAPAPRSGGHTFGAPLLVGTGALDVLAPLLEPGRAAAARQVLADGGAALVGRRPA